jgi:hypothetical protein
MAENLFSTIGTLFDDIWRWIFSKRSIENRAAETLESFTETLTNIKNMTTKSGGDIGEMETTLEELNQRKLPNLGRDVVRANNALAKKPDDALLTQQRDGLLKAYTISKGIRDTLASQIKAAKARQGKIALDAGGIAVEKTVAEAETEAMVAEFNQNQMMKQIINFQLAAKGIIEGTKNKKKDRRSEMRKMVGRSRGEVEALGQFADATILGSGTTGEYVSDLTVDPEMQNALADTYRELGLAVPAELTAGNSNATEQQTKTGA